MIINQDQFQSPEVVGRKLRSTACIGTDLRIISKSIPKSVNYGFDGFGIRQIRNPSGPSVYTE